MAERCKLLTLTLLLSLVCQGRAQSDALSAAKEGAQKLAKAHAGWTRLSSPGASLEAKEILREGSVVQYHLFVHGLPADKLYQLYSWPVSVREPTVQMEGISVGKDGLLICAGRTPEQCGDPSKKDDPIEFTFSSVKAEPFRVAFISGEARVAIVLVPDPIENKHKGCNLKVVRLLPGFELAYLTGSGFAPNTNVEFDSQSYDEKHRLEETTNADGNLEFAMLPFVSGHNNGTMKVKALGTQCSPAVQFDWGR
jgi:hypothetical protein